MTDRLLELFKQSDRDYISGEELSGKLNISRTAVWKQIERLKQQGFQFEAIPRKGYRLLSAPEKFDLPSLLAGCVRSGSAGSFIFAMKWTRLKSSPSSLRQPERRREPSCLPNCKRPAAAAWADAGILRKGRGCGSALFYVRTGCRFLKRRSLPC